jgi:hypothetical protein
LGRFVARDIGGGFTVFDGAYAITEVRKRFGKIIFRIPIIMLLKCNEMHGTARGMQQDACGRFYCFVGFGIQCGC